MIEFYLWGVKVAGYIIMPLTFIGAWLYCIATYGFLLGVGLGWIPAAISALALGFVGAWGWPVVVAFLWMMIHR